MGSVSTRIGQEVTGEAMTISVGRLQVHGYLQSYQKDLISMIFAMGGSCGADGVPARRLLM
ncbi:hypothetical protein ACFY20_44860 [Streptomyces sp. NPDC001312]|uniref:hypothetical protein n=1 Tax=Streptomyces sp. NPDC001312 TaxID=3364561 RepID=UPI0036C5389F